MAEGNRLKSGQVWVRIPPVLLPNERYTMAEFKIGDLVECINNESVFGTLPLGQKAKVVSINDGFIYIQWDQDETVGGYYPWRFKKVVEDNQSSQSVPREKDRFECLIEEIFNAE